jgi:peptide/nickel transport system substrate-binding protein
MSFSRRDMMKLGAAGAMGLGATGLVAGLGSQPALAEGEVLNIAYNVNLPSWDPTTGPSAVNPTIQGIYQSVFDMFIAQNPDLSFAPGLLTEWGWSDDKKQVKMKVRQGVTWHDGSPFTAEDIVWSLNRAADPKTGNPINFVWAKITNIKAEGDMVIADVKEFEPTLFKWMAFLTGFVLPKAYYEKVGAEGFEAKPIGTGPYMVDAFERNAFVRLKAHPGYWGPKPAFETVVIKFVPDAASRVAEVESGKSQVTFDIPFDEYDRLKGKSGLAGEATAISDIGMIFLTNKEGPVMDKNIRLAMHHAINKQLLIDRLLNGYGVAIDTLQAPQYAAFDPSIKVGYDEAKAKELVKAAGFSPENPAKIKIQSTRGLKPKDYEMIQAIVGMWRKVGIEAEIEVYEVAKHFELRFGHGLAPAAFYNWGNAIGDPSTSTGFAMFSFSPHSAWKADDLDKMIGPLWGEPDEAKRIAGYKAADKYIAENGYVIPLLQYVQPLIHAAGIKVVASQSGVVLPSLMTKA